MFGLHSSLCLFVGLLLPCLIYLWIWWLWFGFLVLVVVVICFDVVLVAGCCLGLWCCLLSGGLVLIVLMCSVLCSVCLFFIIFNVRFSVYCAW